MMETKVDVKGLIYELEFMRLATEEGILTEEIESGKFSGKELEVKKFILKSVARKTKRMCVQMTGRTSSKGIPF